MVRSTKGLLKEIINNFKSGKPKVRYSGGSEITSVSELDSAIAAGKSFNFMDVVNKNGIWGDAPKTVFKKGTTIDQIGKYMNKLSKNGTLDPDPLKAGQYTIKVGGIKVNGFLSNTRTPMTVFPSN